MNSNRLMPFFWLWVDSFVYLAIKEIILLSTESPRMICRISKFYKNKSGPVAKLIRIINRTTPKKILYSIPLIIDDVKTYISIHFFLISVKINL